jgi:hypothetical protein
MGQKHGLGFLAVTALALVVGQGVAVAQGQATETAPAPSAQVGLSRQVNLTPAEQLSRADSNLTQMESSRMNVRRQLEAARAQRDVVKTLCLNDKLNQIDVALRSAKERRSALDLAVGRKDVDLANHEFTILGVLSDRGKQLGQEAAQCIGQEAGFIGESAVTSTIDPTLPEDDVSQYPFVPILVQTPLCASCVE